jgi:hypothetical protein
MQTTLPSGFQDFSQIIHYTLLRERRLYLAGPRLLSLTTESGDHTHFRLEHFSRLSPIGLPDQPLRALSIRIHKTGEDETCRYFKVKTGGSGGWFYELIEFKGFRFISEYRRGEWQGA